MKSLKSITTTLTLLLALSLVSQSDIAECADKEMPLTKILSDASIEATTYWNFGDNTFFVVVSSYVKKLENAKLTVRKLTVYKKQNARFLKVFEHEAGLDAFVGMFPLGDNSNVLMTIWVGGSAYHYNVFTISAGKVSPALESGSHNYPELVDLDNDGKEEILLSEGAFLLGAGDKVIRYPQKTSV